MCVLAVSVLTKCFCCLAYLQPWCFLFLWIEVMPVDSAKDSASLWTETPTRSHAALLSSSADSKLQQIALWLPLSLSRTTGCHVHPSGCDAASQGSKSEYVLAGQPRTARVKSFPCSCPSLVLFQASQRHSSFHSQAEQTCVFTQTIEQRNGLGASPWHF